MSTQSETIRPVAGDYRVVSIDQIQASPLNPRPAVKDEDMKDLADSIKQHGIKQAPLVRPLDGSEELFEMVAGWRRWTCAKSAGLEQIEVKVENVSDMELVEIALIENKHRRNLHPMDEALKMEWLLKEDGYDVAMLARKLSKREDYVYRRLVLCKLDKEVQKLFLDNKLNVEQAQMAATIGDTKLQKAFGKEVAKGEDWGVNKGQPMTTNAARKLYNDKFMTSFDHVQWDLNDAELVKDAGACATCQHNSSNAPALFTDLGGKGSFCANAPCFQSKIQAYRDREFAAARQAGAKVLTDKQADQVFAYGGTVRSDAPYVDLEATCYQDISGKKPRSYAKLVGDDVTPVVCFDSKGALRHLADSKEVKKVLAEKHQIKDTGTVNAPPTAAEKKKKEEERSKQKISAMATAEAIATAATNGVTCAPKFATPGQHGAFRAVVIDVIKHVWNDTQKAICKHMLIEVPKGQNVGEVLLKHVLELQPEAQYGFLCAVAAARSYSGPGSLSNEYRKHERSVIEGLDINYKEIEKAVTEQVKKAQQEKEEKTAKKTAAKQQKKRHKIHQEEVLGNKPKPKKADKPANLMETEGQTVTVGKFAIGPDAEPEAKPKAKPAKKAAKKKGAK